MITELPMVCVCDFEGVRQAEERRLRIFRRMPLRDMRDLTEAIVMSLAFDFSCDAEVCADQWFGIALRTPLLKDPLFIPCDDPADGFAALWEHLVVHLPERVLRGRVQGGTLEPPSKLALAVTERVSRALLEQCQKAERDYDSHRDAAHNGPNDCPPCEDCDVFLTLLTVAKLALAAKWGASDLDICAAAAFA